MGRKAALGGLVAQPFDLEGCDEAGEVEVAADRFDVLEGVGDALQIVNKALDYASRIGLESARARRRGHAPVCGEWFAFPEWTQAAAVAAIRLSSADLASS